MAQIVTAQFVGQTSCGFVSKKYYEIEISAGRSGCLCVRDVQGQGFCPYSTLAALRKNWKIINNEKTPGGEPGRAVPLPTKIPRRASSGVWAKARC